MNNEFWAQVKDITSIAKDTFQVRFTYDKGALTFSPGQYVWVVLPQLDYPDVRGERRAFSITSAISDVNSFTIQFRNSGSGYKKTLLSLKLGGKVKIIGPFGSSYIPSNDQKKIVMIAGGVGIAPFLSILRSLGQTNLSLQYSLIYVNSSPDSGVFYDELKNMLSSHNIPFINHIGNLKENLFPLSTDFANDTFFICGPIGMVEEAYKILATKNVPFHHMHFEQHYPTIPGNLTEEDFIQKPGEKNIMLQAVQDSRNHVIITDANGLVIFANKKAQENTGFTFDEMRGNTPRLWGGLMPAKFYQNFWHKKQEAQGFDGELTNRRKNGQIYYVLAHISPIINEQDRVIGYIGTEEDISERIKTSLLIAHDKAQDEAVLSSIGDGLVALNEKGEVMLVNQAVKDLLGWSKDELIGKVWVDMIPLIDNQNLPVPKENRPFSIALLKGEKISASYNYQVKDKSILPVAITVSPIIFANRSIGAIEVFRDIRKEREIDKAKTEFISLASHQLRTPLSTINWYCEMLLDGDAGPMTEQQKNFVNEAYQGSRHMVKLVNALLNVSRIEAGTYMVQPEKVDVVKLAQSTLEESQLLINEKNIVVTFNTEEVPEILLDPNLMTIILQNLITNAVKYTDKQGKVNIDIKVVKKGFVLGNETVSQDSLLLQVKDNGMGIPNIQKPQIFQKMFRADNARKSQTDGNGLGLYLVKFLIEHSQGKIWFDSEEGKGTTFFVLIPLTGMVVKEGTKKLDL